MELLLVTALVLLALGQVFMRLGILMLLLAQLSHVILEPAAKALARQSRRLEQQADKDDRN